MHLRLENFDGPLDLLLHLIKSQELNIFNIPIFLITEQFLSFLKQVNELDFHIAGDFLAMASQLIEIKAQLLLPVLQKSNEINPGSVEEIPEEDPRKILVEQLLEFDALKKASLILETMNLQTQDLFPTAEHKRREDEFSNFEHPIKGNPYDLIISLERVLLRFNKIDIPKVTVRAQKITIQQKMKQIKDKLKDISSLLFRELLTLCSNRYELIVLIMALLELCKANHLVLFQAEIFSEIEITRGENFFEDSAQIQEGELPLQETP